MPRMNRIGYSFILIANADILSILFIYAKKQPPRPELT